MGGKICILMGQRDAHIHEWMMMGTPSRTVNLFAYLIPPRRETVRDTVPPNGSSVTRKPSSNVTSIPDFTPKSAAHFFWPSAFPNAVDRRIALVRGYLCIPHSSLHVAWLVVTVARTLGAYCARDGRPPRRLATYCTPLHGPRWPLPGEPGT